MIIFIELELNTNKTLMHCGRSLKHGHLGQQYQQNSVETFMRSKQSRMNEGITPGLYWFDYSARGSYKFQSKKEENNSKCN